MMLMAPWNRPTMLKSMSSVPLLVTTNETRCVSGFDLAPGPGFGGITFAKAQGAAC